MDLVRDFYGFLIWFTAVAVLLGMLSGVIASLFARR